MAALLAASAALAVPGLAAGQAAAPDTARREVASGRRPWPEQPRVVMLRSLLVPGWGQFHNRAWLKAVGVAGTETWLISAVLKDKREVDDRLAEVDAARAAQDEARYADAVNRYNDQLDTYIGRQWLLGGLLAYALVDAYVDAHFRDFDLEFRHDPALPEAPPESPAAAGRGGSARGGRTSLALRWTF